MHLSMLIWRPGKGRGFHRGSRPIVGTFDYRQVSGGGGATFEFHLFTDASVDLKL